MRESGNRTPSYAADHEHTRLYTPASIFTLIQAIFLISATLLWYLCSTFFLGSLPNPHFLGHYLSSFRRSSSLLPPTEPNFKNIIFSMYILGLGLWGWSKSNTNGGTKCWERRQKFWRRCVSRVNVWTGMEEMGVCVCGFSKLHIDDEWTQIFDSVSDSGEWGWRMAKATHLYLLHQLPLSALSFNSCQWGPPLPFIFPIHHLSISPHVLKHPLQFWLFWVFPKLLLCHFMFRFL